MKITGYTTEIFHLDKSDVVHVSGRIDSMNYESFLAECLYAGTNRALVIDMDGLDYISSAGIRVLIILAKKYRDAISIVNAGPFVMDVLITTGIAAIISVKAAAQLEGEKTAVSQARSQVFAHCSRQEKIG